MSTVESKSVIATTTFYPEWYPGTLNWQPEDEITRVVEHKVRGDLAIEMTAAASEKGIAAIVVEGTGNTHPFRQALHRPIVHIFKETAKGMSPSRQQSFSLALQEMPAAEAILWLEPEKVSIIKDCFRSLMVPLVNGEADVTVPLRDQAAFATYPDYQADAEQESNFRWNQMLREAGLLSPDQSDLDVWHGPKGFHRSVAGLFLRKYRSTNPENKLVRPEQYSNSIFIPVIAALAAGKRVLSVPVNYRHPEIQTQTEQNSPIHVAKRQDQQDSILATCQQYIFLLLDQPSDLELVV